MKKIITFLLCLNIVLSAAACAKIDRPDDIDNGSQPSVSETEVKPNDPEEELYDQAVSLLESGDLYGAYDIFLTIPHVKDAGEYLSRFSFGYEQYDYERADDDYKYTAYFEYDEYGRKVFSRIIYNDGIEHTYGYVYDDKGNLIEELKNGVIYHIYKYDEAGNPIKMIPADGYASELEYDENGNITNSVNFPNCSLPMTGVGRVAIAHKNTANMIGQFSSVLGSEDINISDMNNLFRLLFVTYIRDPRYRSTIITLVRLRLQELQGQATVEHV